MTTEETTIFKLKSGDKFTVPSLCDEPKDTVFTFHHLDGMYSYCTFNDDEVAHFEFNTPVEIVK